MHGHKYDVKNGIYRAYMRAAEKNAELLLFGHTHEPADLTQGNIRLFNPGSIGKGYPRKTYGVINISDGQIICGHGEINSH